MKHTALKYSLKVWLTSVAGAPLLFTIYLNMHSNGLSIYNVIMMSVNDYWMFTLFEALFSLPTWLLFWLAVMFARRYFSKAVYLKVTICFAGIFLTMATFFFWMSPQGFFETPFFTNFLLWINSLCIGGGVWFYKLDVDQQLPELT